MDRAVGIDPDNVRVRMARGVILQIETPGMPRFANHPGLVEQARADYQRMWELRQDRLTTLGDHQLGELLQGLADLHSRQGKVAEAESYYRTLLARLPDTEYGTRAAQWLESRQPLPTSQTTCVGCHEAK
jgi:hypothetical protein